MQISISFKVALPVDVHAKVPNRKTVKVKSYSRIRNGKIEKVRSYHRKV